ncbi:methyl-accepting chemotaxis protein [Halanaerobacter jeridensis]|uniref:Methyl-accepting chemotaxis protein n=1 Tax=Halanaerobacter jeridensis TaxID=706427 RepID=A0A939BS91_9FIRM|nr:methyl-accepting chemotaxis protein [Halanaerobacter jeridensis]MBM7556881.1 methyl-accepting chemotaxis protein [Halanaerobacter jeridensis]
MKSKARATKFNFYLILIIYSLFLVTAKPLYGTEYLINLLKILIPAVIALTIIFFLPLNKEYQSILLPLTFSIAGIVYSYSMQGKIEIFLVHVLTILLNSLYFDQKLMLSYSGILNTIIIIAYWVNPSRIVGVHRNISDFIHVMSMFMGVPIILYYSTKWSNQNLKDTVKEKKKAEKISNKIQNVFDKINQLSGELLDYSNTLAANAEEGSSAIQNNNNNLKSIVQQINQISENSKQINNATKNTTGEIKTGKNNIETTIKSMRNINDEVQDAVMIINDLDNNSQEIEQITELINNIAEQTNLLSLNASIEAARAGEAGKGFAVVANEIRELAEQTAQATEKIDNLIERTKNKSKKGLNIIKSVKDKTETGQQTIEETGQVFQKIKNAMSNNLNQIQDITSSIQKVNSNSSELMYSSESIENMSEDIAQSSQELTTMAQKLENLSEK